MGFVDSKVLVNVRMSLLLKKRLEERARKEDRSLTNLIMVALKKYLEEQEIKK